MARARTVRTGGMTIDVTGLREAAVALRKTETAAYRDYTKALRVAGEKMAVVARKKAAEHSKTIPPTIKVRVAGAQVSIQGGSKTVPIGALFEVGDKSHPGRSAALTAGEGGTFRHPLFGNRDHWYDQPMHPYLYPAYVETREETLHEIDGVFVAAFRSSGIEAS